MRTISSTTIRLGWQEALLDALSRVLTDTVIFGHQTPWTGLAGHLAVNDHPVLGGLHHQYYLVDCGHSCLREFA